VNLQDARCNNKDYCLLFLSHPLISPVGIPYLLEPTLTLKPLSQHFVVFPNILPLTRWRNWVFPTPSGKTLHWRNEQAFLHSGEWRELPNRHPPAQVINGIRAQTYLKFTTTLYARHNVW